MRGPPRQLAECTRRCAHCDSDSNPYVLLFRQGCIRSHLPQPRVQGILRCNIARGNIRSGWPAFVGVLLVWLSNHSAFFSCPSSAIKHCRYETRTHRRLCYDTGKMNVTVWCILPILREVNIMRIRSCLNWYRVYARHSNARK